ncbi:hypothetical protein [uncultured Tateyamaria sp.]|uniref:hypothetical protein n=1 Tax=Tateyamaria sp. 1078 TaxID=3417464 RepID=UPI002629FBF9|nr:hypothetical protein [uncultured Tateyamaria sp.]
MRNHLLCALAFAALPLTVAAQDTDLTGGKEIPKRTCVDSQRFFLRNDMVRTQIGQELGTCRTFTGGRAAKFSYTRDGIADSWTVSTDAAFGYVLKETRSPSALAGLFPSLVSSSLIAFAEIDGERTSAGVTSGTGRVGLIYEAMFLPGNPVFSYGVLDVVPYYRFGLDGDAKGHGLEVAYVPVFGPLNHNALVDNRQDKVIFSTSSVFRLDAYHSDTGGNTGLGNGQDYLWVGADLGAKVKFRNAKRTVAEAGLEISHYRDLESGVEATQGIANLSFPLDDKEIASFDLTYTHGRTRDNLTKVESFKVSLGIKF